MFGTALPICTLVVVEEQGIELLFRLESMLDINIGTSNNDILTELPSEMFATLNLTYILEKEEERAIEFFFKTELIVFFNYGSFNHKDLT